MCSKNHFGSLPAPALHYSLPAPVTGFSEPTVVSNGNYGVYRCFVDVIGFKHLGGKTMLYVIDGIWGSINWGHPPIKWRMAPFNNDWPNSIFMSQDPVAIESVGFDFMYKEFDVNHPTEGGVAYDDVGPFPQFPGTDDFLHQSADSKNRPSTFTYDPENDGTPLPASMGTYEHWNNASDKQYSRNLGLNKGIELLKNIPVGINIVQLSNESGFKNSPNPFSSSTTIQYKLNHLCDVNLVIYDTKGREIIRLINGAQKAGEYKVKWNGLHSNGQPLSTGIYFAKMSIRNGGNVNHHELKMVLNK